MTIKSASTDDPIFADSGEAVGVHHGAVGVAAIRTPSPPSPQRACWSAMESYAALIAEHTPIRAVPLPLIRDDPDTVASRIMQLPARVEAVFLIGLDASGASHVQREVAAAGGPAVISELDAVTVALAAAVVTFLRRRDATIRPRGVVVTSADAAPRLGTLLAALEVGSMTTWHRYDAEDYPLARVMACNDVLIDLAGIAAHSVAPGRTLTMPSDPYQFAALVVPGLLSGLCGREHTPITINILAACSRAISLVTPEDQLLPDITERLLIPAVARHVQRVLSDP